MRISSPHVMLNFQVSFRGLRFIVRNYYRNLNWCGKLSTSAILPLLFPGCKRWAIHTSNIHPSKDSVCAIHPLTTAFHASLNSFCAKSKTHYIWVPKVIDGTIKRVKNSYLYKHILAQNLQFSFHHAIVLIKCIWNMTDWWSSHHFLSMLIY